MTGFELLIGMAPKGYRERTPVLFDELQVENPEPPPPPRKRSAESAELGRLLAGETPPPAASGTSVIPTAERAARRAWGSGPPTKACEVCKDPFAVKSNAQVTCGRTCGGILRSRRNAARGGATKPHRANGGPPPARSTSHIGAALAATRSNVQRLLGAPEQT